jgi:hypothetical protein
MLFDLTFPCYLTTLSGKKCLSGRLSVLSFVPFIEVLLYWKVGGCAVGEEGVREVCLSMLQLCTKS